MRAALEALDVDALTIVHPGTGVHPLSERIRVAGLADLRREMETQPDERERERTAARTRAGRAGYNHPMKRKTSITLDEDVMAAVEAAARAGENRSQVIERLLRESLAARERAALDARDRSIIDAHAEALNEEAIDVLGYQVET